MDVLVEVRDSIATVTVNRPTKLNALNVSVIDGLIRTFESLRGDDSAGVVILTGAGDNAFVAGADISGLATLDAAASRDMAVKGQRLMLLIERLGKPVIAAVNGFALGGGCELAMACTLRIAAEDARLGQPEVKLGILAGYGGTQRMPRLVGTGRALELLLTGDPIDAPEALRIGLVNRVVPRDRLMDECLAVARKILSVGPIAVRNTIEAVYRGLDVTLDEGLSIEAELFGKCFDTEDRKEGTAAFLEKRPPRFTGK